MSYVLVNRPACGRVRHGRFGRYQKHGGQWRGLPALIAGAKKGARTRFLEFFTVTIRNPNTRGTRAPFSYIFPGLLLPPRSIQIHILASFEASILNVSRQVL